MTAARDGGAPGRASGAAMVPVGLVCEVLEVMVPAGCGWLVPEVLRVFGSAADVAGGAGALKGVFGGDRRHLSVVVPHLVVVFGRYAWAMAPAPAGCLDRRDVLLLLGLSHGLTYRQMAPQLGLAPGDGAELCAAGVPQAGCEQRGGRGGAGVSGWAAVGAAGGCQAGRGVSVTAAASAAAAVSGVPNRPAAVLAGLRSGLLS